MKKVKKFKLSSLHIVLLIAAAGAAAILGTYFSGENQFDWSRGVSHQWYPVGARLLDGEIVGSDYTALKPIAVILENHYDARPVAGLEAASIVYETIVEGDITRFLAIFDSNIQAKKIGPVRSARPFFVDLAEEWNAVLFHAGGSSGAIEQLKKSPIYNINEISSDGIYFWRDANRSQPHNLFTSADLIKRALAAKDINTKADFKPWLFKSDQPAKDSLVDEINVYFSTEPLYQVKYLYNKDDNDYTRYLAGKVHKTETGIILKAKNVVLQHVEARVIDNYGRLSIDLTSGGKAEVYQDGKEIKGTWENKSGRTRYYDGAGKEISFNRGKIWVELVFD